jgi:hypothetical protein
MGKYVMGRSNGCVLNFGFKGCGFNPDHEVMDFCGY